MRFFNDKKGNWVDIFVWIAVAMVLMISISFIYYFNTAINDSLLSVDIVQNNTDANNLLQTREARLPYIFDFILPLLYLGFVIASGISARIVLSSHMFTPVMLIISPILIMFGAVVEIVWDKLVSGTNAFALSIADLTVTNVMLDKFIFFVLFYILVVGVSLYTKDD